MPLSSSPNVSMNPVAREPLVEGGVLLPDAIEYGFRELREDAVGGRGCDQVGPVGVDTGSHRRF